MAVLSNQDRFDIWALFMRFSSNIREAIGINKPELRAAVDATDQWISDNQASFNSALPEPSRSNLTQKQKVRLFLEVAQRRFNVEV